MTTTVRLRIKPEARMVIELLPECYGVLDTRIKPKPLAVCIHDTIGDAMACATSWEATHEALDGLGFPDGAGRYEHSG